MLYFSSECGLEDQEFKSWSDSKLHDYGVKVRTFCQRLVYYIGRKYEWVKVEDRNIHAFGRDERIQKQDQS